MFFDVSTHMFTNMSPQLPASTSSSSSSSILPADACNSVSVAAITVTLPSNG